MLDVHRVKRLDHIGGYGVSSVAGSSGGSTGDAFKEQLRQQLKDEYKKHISSLFDELSALADTFLGRIDISAFERYRQQLKDLLQEAIKNAYVLSSEHVTDMYGRQRVFETIHIIDSKLDDLAKDILLSCSNNLDYLSRVDEIRGLLMDLLL
jgi:uncharacterized protein